MVCSIEEQNPTRGAEVSGNRTISYLTNNLKNNYGKQSNTNKQSFYVLIKSTINI